MPPKKRTPKAITTDATKHKVPLPANHPQKRKRKPKLPEKAFENAPSPEAEAFARLMNVPVDKLNNPLMQEGIRESLRLTDAELDALHNFPLRAIPCGEDVASTSGRPFNVKDYGVADWERDAFVDMATETDASVAFAYAWETQPAPPPDTTPYPWAGLSDAWAAFRLWLARTLSALATWLKRLATKVAP